MLFQLEPETKKMKLVDGDSLTDTQYKQLKKDLPKPKSSQIPSFRLKFFGEKASMTIPPTKRQPLMLDDIQYLLMSALLGSSSPFKPHRWCVLEKANKVSHTVLLVIEGLTSYNFMSNESRFVKTKEIFEDQLEVVLPKYQKNRLIEELSSVPLTQSLKDKLITKYGSLEAAMSLNKDHHLIAKSVFPIDGDVTAEDSCDLFEGETFPRTRLLLSPLQMLIEGYPIPLNGEYKERYEGFRMSRDSYKSVTSRSPMFGLDCEMCRTVRAENELARVSIVDENYESVYETLVRPTNKIVDYLTPWSGITKEMMENVTKTLEEVQEDVCNLLPSDAILVGQSLNCDLNAMKLMHPYVIDTSVIFNLHGERNRKSKLQTLAKTFLDEDIQKDQKGHSSIEDSQACLKLTKLKLSKDIYFGDLMLQKVREKKESPEEIKISSGIVNNTDEAAKAEPKITTTLFSPVIKHKKKLAIITTNNSECNLGKFYGTNPLKVLTGGQGDELSDHGIQHHKESSARKVIKKTREVALDNAFNMSYFNVIEDSLNEDESTDGSASTDDDKVAELIPKIDKWIEKVWSSVAVNGLFVVIFGGQEKNTNGVSMIKIKH